MDQDSGVKSAGRVFEILELFRTVKTPLRLKDITDRLGYAPSSASGLLKTMAANGYLEFDETERSYFPTVYLAQLTAWIPGLDFERTAVIAAMRHCNQATGEMVGICAVSGLFVEFIEVERSTHDIQLWTPAGTRHPIVRVAVGWMLLNEMLDYGMPANKLDEIYKQSLAQGLINKEDLTPSLFARQLKQARKEEFLFTTAETYAPQVYPGQAGGSMISTIIPRPAGHRPLALVVGGPAHRIKKDRAHLMRELQTAKAMLTTACSQYQSGTAR